MKKLILFTFLLISIFIFSQKYHFDYFVQTSSSTDNIIISDSSPYHSFFESKDKKIVLRLVNISKKSNAILVDEERGLRHYLKVIEKKGSLSFEYLYTNKLFSDGGKINFQKDDYYKIKEVKPLKFEVKIYKNSNYTDLLKNFVVTYEKSPINYTKIRSESFSYDNVNNQLQKLLGEGSHRIIEIKAKVKEFNHPFFEKFNYIESVNFDVNLPDKLIYKDYERPNARD